MVEQFVNRVHTEQILLDIGEDVGALIVYTGRELHGRQIEVSPQENSARKIHTDVHERYFNGQTRFAAVFQALEVGVYTIWRAGSAWGTVTITGGTVYEVDWHDVGDEVFLFCRHDRGIVQRTGNPSSSLANILPPRYQDGRAVSAAPMGAAPLCYDADGQVAWDQMWSDFCELALAGGPPHRGTLLEPVTPEEVRMDPVGYERVVAEIERGLRLVTGLTAVRSEKPGWVGLVCTDEEMALWLLRAIIVENVCVRRETNVLFFPAGPAFSLEKEIKNVITVVAKTHHYWIEHCKG